MIGPVNFFIQLKNVQVPMVCLPLKIDFILLFIHVNFRVFNEVVIKTHSILGLNILLSVSSYSSFKMCIAFRENVKNR